MYLNSYLARDYMQTKILRTFLASDRLERRLTGIHFYSRGDSSSRPVLYPDPCGTTDRILSCCRERLFSVHWKCPERRTAGRSGSADF